MFTAVDKRAAHYVIQSYLVTDTYREIMFVCLFVDFLNHWFRVLTCLRFWWIVWWIRISVVIVYFDKYINASFFLFINQYSFWLSARNFLRFYIPIANSMDKGFTTFFKCFHFFFQFFSFSCTWRPFSQN